MKLKIGKIAYANLFPLFYTLEKEFDCSGYDFVEGVPSELNGKIRRGEIDISPSSSVEYLRNPEKYDIIEDHSISSYGPVRSIFLFSRKPIEALGGGTVLISSQSETSAALIQIIMKKFYGLDCAFLSTSLHLREALKSHGSYLLIGDEALKENLSWPELLRYDIGDIWYRKTGLPFTFALWIVRKACCNEHRDMLDQFILDLNSAKQLALQNLPEIAAASPLNDLVSGDGLIAYWKGMSYDLGPEHKAGLELFRQYADELGLL